MRFRQTRYVGGFLLNTALVAALSLTTGTAGRVVAPSTLCSPPPPTSEMIYAITSANQLVSFDSASPGTTSSTITITGLVSSDTLVAIDFRPSTLTLYGLGLNGTIVHLYQINRTTGVAAQVGGDISLPQSAGAAVSETFGFDFNPVTDSIRVVSNGRDNFRLNPNNGAVAGADTILTPAGSLIVGAAYTNN